MDIPTEPTYPDGPMPVGYIPDEYLWGWLRGSDAHKLPRKLAIELHAAARASQLKADFGVEMQTIRYQSAGTDRALHLIKRPLVVAGELVEVWEVRYEEEVTPEDISTSTRRLYATEALARQMFGYRLQEQMRPHFAVPE